MADAELTRRHFLGATLVAGGAIALGCETARAEPPDTSKQAPGARWEFGRTWVLAIGILRWQDSESWASFPAEGRRDAVLVQSLVQLGVPADHVVFLRDQQATRAEMTSQLGALLARIPAGDSLIFYYAGHGHREESGATYFVTHDAGDDLARTAVPFSHVVDAITTRFRGSRALLFADCCYSGALAELSAAHAGGPPRAAFGASSASEGSTGHWTFTDALIAGLAGESNVDVDANGLVTIGDLGSFVEAQMAFAEGQLATCRASGLATTLSLVSARPRPHPRFGERVEAQYQGRWWPATITGVEGAQIRVHYDGFEGAWDELMSADRVRPYRPEEYPIGTTVDVRWGRRWYPASVLEARLGVHRIHYDGFVDAWDEWVARDRIRPRGALESGGRARGRRR